MTVIDWLSSLILLQLAKPTKPQLKRPLSLVIWTNTLHLILGVVYDAESQHKEMSSGEIVTAIQNGEMDTDAFLLAAHVRPYWTITPEKLSQLW